MKFQTFKKISFILIHLFIFTFMSVVLITRAFIGLDWGSGIISGFNGSYFKYFTSLSNFYNGAVSLYLLVVFLLHIKEKEYRFKKIDRIIALSATMGVAVTFVVTVTFLTITISDKSLLYANELIVLHVIAPILTIVSYIFLLKGERLNKRDVIFSVIPLFIYATLYSILVLSDIWSDHYGFTFGGHKWTFFIVYPLINLIGYGVSYLLELCSYLASRGNSNGKN